MKYALLFVFLLSGCTTVVPVARNFPEAPEVVLQKCPDLKQLADGAKLSDVAKTVAENYTTYYQCSNKSDAWIEWYKSQKQIFESVK